MAIAYRCHVAVWTTNGTRAELSDRWALGSDALDFEF